MSFTYNFGIPDGPNDPADDQPRMKTNFQSISDLIDVDHVGFNVATAGQHDQISFALNQAAPAAGAANSVLYTNLVSSISELFFRNSRKSDIQLTDLVINDVGNGGSAGGTQFVIDTPWNVRILCGLTNTISSGSSKDVTYPTSFTTIYTALATSNDTNAHYVSAQTVTNGTLRIKTDAAIKVSWLVIGRV